MSPRALALLGGCALVVTGCAHEEAAGRPWVRNVRFEGVESVDARDLARRLRVEQTNWLRRPKRFLDPFTVESDRARIEAYYRAHGFFSARVTAAEVTPRSGDPAHPTSVDVLFAVDEGRPTEIESVEVSGLEAAAAKDELERAFRKVMKPGARFVHERYEEARAALEAQLRELGYAWVTLDDRVEVNRDTHTARVLFAVTPGPVVHFGRVSVEGLARVSERALVNHAGLDAGTRFSPEALEEARGRIYSLGLFSSVRVDYVRDDADPTRANAVVRVRESAFNDLRLGVGVALESMRTEVHATVGYARYNWLGGLRTLQLELEPAWVSIPTFWRVDRTGPALHADAKLRQPDWPCRRCELDFLVGFDVGIEYPYQNYGPRTSLALIRGFWHDRVRLGASYNFQLLQFFDTDQSVLTDPVQAGRLFGYTNPYRLGWLQEDVSLDLRDQAIGARRGVYVAASFEQGGVYAGGAFFYEKITPELRAYAPLGGRVTAAGRVQFGQLFSQSDLGSPVTRRYYLGGPDSQRGFNYDRLSPQVPSGKPGGAPLPIGGDQMFLFQVELRVDLFRLFGNWVSIAGFLDGGDVGAPSCGASCGPLVHAGGVDWGQLNYATGGGLRYRTILGVVRFDVGVRLNRLTPFEPNGTPNADPGERLAFHLSVGEAF